MQKVKNKTELTIKDCVMSAQGRGIFSLILSDGKSYKVRRSTLGQYIVINRKRVYTCYIKDMRMPKSI